MTVDEMFDLLEEYDIASDDFIKGAICMGGYNQETAERVLFYWTGWRSFEGFMSEFEDEKNF